MGLKVSVYEKIDEQFIKDLILMIIFITNFVIIFILKGWL